MGGPEMAPQPPRRSARPGEPGARLVSRLDQEDSMATVTVHGGASGLAQELLIGRHRAIADEPVADGGGDTGPSPYDYRLTAPGASTPMTLAQHARKKGWPR